MKHLAILGSGSAAITAAHTMLAKGWRVTLYHSGLPIGGTCLHVGCVPSKYMIRAAEALHRSQQSPFPSIRPQGASLDWSALIQAQQEKIAALRERNYEGPLPARKNLEIIPSTARFYSAQEIEDERGHRIHPDAILIATGSQTYLPPIKGLAATPYLTNENGFNLPEVPASCLVLGGGYIALEYAQMLNRFGCKVTVLQRSHHILSNQPRDISDALRTYLEREGLQIMTGVHFDEICYHPTSGFTVHAPGQEFTASHLFVGTGRQGQTQDLQLEQAGIQTHGAGFVMTDDQLRTSQPTIYAAGDVLGGKMFVYTASYEAETACHNISETTPRHVDYTGMPWVVFTDPQVAGVGWDETHAREQGYEVETATLHADRWPRFSVANETRGYLTLIRCKNSDRLLGARAVVPEGGDLMTELGRVIRYQIPVRELAEGFSPYLTLSEGIQRAAAKFYP